MGNYFISYEEKTFFASYSKTKNPHEDCYKKQSEKNK